MLDERFEIRVTSTHKQRLRHVAGQLGTTESDIARRAIDEFLDKHQSGDSLD